MFVQELDRPQYLVVEKRGFDDRELRLTPDMVQYLYRLQQDSLLLQGFLREVYQAGDQSWRLGPPQWLVNRVNDEKPEQPVSDQASSKTLRLKPKQMGSSTNTSQSSSDTKGPLVGTNPTSN